MSTRILRVSGLNANKSTYKLNGNQVMVPISEVYTDRAKLASAPRYQSSGQLNWSDRAYTERVDQYWGVGV